MLQESQNIPATDFNNSKNLQICVWLLFCYTIRVKFHQKEHLFLKEIKGTCILNRCPRRFSDSSFHSLVPVADVSVLDHIFASA